MDFARRAIVAGCIALQFIPQLGAVAPHISPAPHVAVRSVGQRSPAPVKDAYTLPPDKLAKAIALGRIRNILDLGGSLWGLAFLYLLLASGAAAGLEAWTGHLSRRRWLQGLAFFALLTVITTLADLPLDIYAHHVSRGYGISVQGWGGWLIDQGKGLGLSLAFGPPVLLLFNWVVRRWPRRYWLVAWVLTVPLMVLSVFVAPWFEPIFNTYEPLAQNHPALTAELERVVARTGTAIPPDRMVLMKASEKTNGLNAYVSGMGATKRIVVWDTTAGRIPDDEVMFIFGHESGHYVLKHIPKGICLTAVALFFIYWGCAGCANRLAPHFRARWRTNGLATQANPLSSRTGFVVLLFVLSAANFLLEPVSNMVSRHFEHQADIYGQEAMHGLVPDPQKTAVAAFNALGEAWLEEPDPSPLIEFWTYSHPSTQHRAIFAAQYDPWANGGRGEFFAR